jgi:hypothetical protein
MISSADFDRIKYRFPRQHAGKPIPTLLGLDTEAYDTGEPFIVCLSDGTDFHPRQFPDILFDRDKYVDSHFGVYNLKYDSGALTYFFPATVKIELWEKTFADYTSPETGTTYRLEYIPHKALFVYTSGKKKLTKIWDISQFFHQSLDSASKRYLNESKQDIETKKFSRQFVKINYARIKSYCVQDASLTARLANFLVDKLSSFSIKTTALYSAASISYRYFSDNAKPITSWRFWERYPELLKYAMDSYEGGKFEITSRGTLDGYEYDICSAYPFELRNLVDISLAKVTKSKHFEPDSQYGFLRVRIDNSSARHIPCGIMTSKVRIYPAGTFYLTITKEEYSYLCSLNIHCDILSAYWLHTPTIKYPYRKVIDKLFSLKSHYKGKDTALYTLTKTLMNSYYGKLCQMIENYNEEIVAGIGWNPMYAAIITANTRIAVTRLQNLLQSDCVAVHTDSVITRKPLDPLLVSTTGALGIFELQYKGPCTLVACGQYEIDDKSAFKGFEPIKITRDGQPIYESWRDILSRNPGKSKFQYPVLRVQSWLDAAAKGKFEKVNYFENTFKEINLNADRKRNWLRKATTDTLLSGLDPSTHLAVYQDKQPEFWGNL